MSTDVASPCVKVCKLVTDVKHGEYCVGCLRTPNEIRSWTYLDNKGKLEILRVVELRRHND
jgi:predicted Fe-S protein YdhL (DUF1289 family)